MRSNNLSLGLLSFSLQTFVDLYAWRSNDQKPEVWLTRGALGMLSLDTLLLRMQLEFLGAISYGKLKGFDTRVLSPLRLFKLDKYARCSICASLLRFLWLVRFFLPLVPTLINHGIFKRYRCPMSI